MSEFYNLTFSTSNIIYLALTCVLLTILPFGFLIYWKKKQGKKTRLKAALIGAIGFVVSARVLELGVHMVCIVLDNPISRIINGSTLLYVIYGAMMAGIFEEVGRYVILKRFVKKENTKENAIMYGIGHGGIEVLTVSLMATATSLAVAIIFSNMGVDEAMTTLKINEEVVSQALPVCVSASNFGFASMFVTIYERFACMFVHIMFTVVVYTAVKKSNKKYLLAAVLGHALIDTLPAISQRITISPWITEAWVTIWGILLILWGLKLYKENNE